MNIAVSRSPCGWPLCTTARGSVRNSHHARTDCNDGSRGNVDFCTIDNSKRQWRSIQHCRRDGQQRSRRLGQRRACSDQYEHGAVEGGALPRLCPEGRCRIQCRDSRHCCQQRCTESDAGEARDDSATAQRIHFRRWQHYTPLLLPSIRLSSLGPGRLNVAESSQQDTVDGSLDRRHPDTLDQLWLLPSTLRSTSEHVLLHRRFAESGYAIRLRGRVHVRF